jgi:hypothetical protein
VLTAAVLVPAAAVTVAVLARPGGRHPPAAGPATTEKVPAFPAATLAPARGVLFGASVQAAGYPGPDPEQAAVAAFERAIGRTLAINNIYVAWTGPMPSATMRWDLARGTLPMITWAAARANLVAGGADDATIRTTALQLKALHAPVFLRWFGEMDLPENQADAVSPATYVAAWRRMHDIFRRAGAANVRWVWCPDASGFDKGIAQAYYPGNAYVDWICTDGYNWASAFRGSSWSSFQQIFAPFYAWGASTGKPLLIGEFGTVEGEAGAKASWFTQADRAIRLDFPAIRAVVYFESDHYNFGRNFNWKVTSSGSSLAAFRRFAHDSYFSATALSPVSRPDP